MNDEDLQFAPRPYEDCHSRPLTRAERLYYPIGSAHVLVSQTGTQLAVLDAYGVVTEVSYGVTAARAEATDDVAPFLF